MNDEVDSFPIDESARRKFEAQWLDGKPEQIEEFLPQSASASFLGTLTELVQIDLEFHWKKYHSQGGEKPPSAAEYLSRFTGLNNSTLKRRLIQQEYLLRYQYGDAPSVHEYQERYPELNLTTNQIRSEFFPLDNSAKSDLAESLEQLPTTIGAYERGETRFNDQLGMLCQANESHSNEQVVLRIVDPQLLAGMSPDEVSGWRILFEATADKTTRLRHAHIAQAILANYNSEIPFYVLNLPPTEPLIHILQLGPLEPRIAAGYANQIVQAINVIHESDQIQGYITPWNILIDTHRNRSLLIDVGFGSILNSLPSKATDKVMHPAYCAPEQLSGGDTTRQSDIYAVGAVLYHMLAGRPPFMASSNQQTKQQVLNHTPIPVHDLNPDVDHRLGRICMACLNRQPNQRINSMKSLTAELSSWSSQKQRGENHLTNIWSRVWPWMGWAVAAVLAGWIVFRSF